MKHTYKHHKVFGPVASFAGIVVFAFGLMASYSSLPGVLFVVVGGLMAFTYSSTIVDVEKRKIRFSINLFGLLPTGKWLSVEDGMQVRVKIETKTYRSYSRSNRVIDNDIKEKKLFLMNKKGKALMPIMTFHENDNIDEVVDKFCEEMKVKRMKR
ncbi:hypothetical protein EYV94_19865 [Puteibacter caeruleilacunae]|nr:hypothetical protein EYV94_19865 [Puteibacter caeruleilacunae]